MTKRNCPVCGAALEPGESCCPICGCKLTDVTQSFEPVALEPSAKDSVQGALDNLVLTVVKGPYEGETFALSCPKMTIGRDPSCDIFLNDMTVSREHALIVCADTGVTIEDQGSLNGTWVDGEITKNAPIKLGTTIQIGTFNMAVEKA